MPGQLLAPVMNDLWEGYTSSLSAFFGRITVEVAPAGASEAESAGLKD